MRKVLIVGGVAGGASAAARLRRLDEDAHIVLFERDSYISFANCGLPYYIGDVIRDRGKLLVQTPEAMRRRFNLDVRTNSEVTAIDTKRRVVNVRSAERGDYEEAYDYIILSPGAKPIRPNLPGIGHERIFTLRNIPDTDKIKEYVTANKQTLKSSVIIGAGFIGVEMAENLRELGLDVTLVEAAPQILAPFDPEMAGVLADEMLSHGVRLRLNERVAGFRDLEGPVGVRFESGDELNADFVILAIGVAPDTGFLQGSGIELGPRGHIRVNERMQTNIESIYAVGDAVLVHDFVIGSEAAVPLAGPANKQGRIAADNIAGLSSVYKGTQGTAIVKIFGMTGAATGAGEKTLKRSGIPYRAIHVHPASHASYYPGAKPLGIKLLFNDNGDVLGTQIVGSDGVDKRIDDIAAIIRMKGTVTDLTELELAYAPPYSSAKDPVNMAGYAAENVLLGLTDVFNPSELASFNPDSAILIDVRTPTEFENGHIEGAKLIPVDELRSRLDELDPGKEIWVYCQVGLRGYTAARILRQRGFQVKNMTGGFKTYLMYKSAGL